MYLHGFRRVRMYIAIACRTAPFSHIHINICGSNQWQWRCKLKHLQYKPFQAKIPEADPTPKRYCSPQIDTRPPRPRPSSPSLPTWSRSRRCRRPRWLRRRWPTWRPWRGRPATKLHLFPISSFTPCKEFIHIDSWHRRRCQSRRSYLFLS